MPKIAAATVAENREQRREALLNAAAGLMHSGGTFTVAEVAREVGLSRSAVYEYYSSASELIADVVVDELTAWSQSLDEACDPAGRPRERVHAWIRGVLSYVVDGRHALLRSVAAIDLPPARRADVQALHEAVIAPLVGALTAARSPDPVREARFVWGVVDAAIQRIEAGECVPSDEISAVVRFIDGALTPILGRDAIAWP